MSKLEIWNRTNIRRGAAYLWSSVASVAGMLDILGMVVVVFTIGLLPGAERLSELAWFKPTVVVLGFLLLAFFTALRATAELGAYQAANERRNSEFRRQYLSLLGDIRDLMTQVREIEAGRVLPTRNITPRWPEFEFVNVVLDDIDQISEKLNGIIARSYTSGEVNECVSSLRRLCDEATKRLQQVYEQRGSAPKAEPPPLNAR